MQIANRCLSAAFIGCVLLGTSWAQAADQVPAYIQAAIASNRPEADVQRDVNRKPAEVLMFSGMKPGDQVGELMPGRGYYTALFCKIVGDKGHVHAINFRRATPPPAGAPAGGMPTPPAPPCNNVTAATQLASELALPSGLDIVWTSENYHDFLNNAMGASDMARFNKTVFDSLKPGGIYLIEDHAAAAGAGSSVTETLHRVDAQFVKQQVLAAGFVLEAESALLRNGADPHTERAHQMEGKSDKFLLKFRKPSK